jgi:hypothetical protein
VKQYSDVPDNKPDRGEQQAGERVLFTITPADGPQAMVLADPGTMATTRVELPDRTARTECIFMEPCAHVSSPR